MVNLIGVIELKKGDHYDLPFHFKYLHFRDKKPYSTVTDFARFLG